MNNLLKLGKKVFTVGVASTTIFWSLGVAALVPAVASAATVTTVDCATVVAGDFIKGTGAAVWLVNSDKTMSYFPDGDTFKSWTVDGTYKSIKLVDATCMGTFPQASIVAARPGSYLLKDDATNKLYTVTAAGKLAPITAEVAKALYGTTYDLAPAKGGRTVKVATPDMMNYNKNLSTTSVTEAAAMEGSLVSNGGKYYVVGANKSLREVTATGLTANKFQKKLAYALTSTSGYTMGTAVDAADASLMDASFGYKSNGTTLPVVTGALTASLAANTPAGAAVPYKATHVPFLTFNANFQNAGTVYSVSLKRIGLGASTNFDKVWLESNGTPVSNAQTVSSDDTVTLTPNLSVAAGTTSFTVVANLKSAGASASTEDAFQVTAIDAGKGVTTAGLPVAGNKMSYRAVDVASVTLADKGADASVKVGDTATLGEFNVVYSSGNNTNGSFEYIRLRNTGNASLNDLKNLVLMENGAAVTAPATVSGDYATFKLNSDAKELKDGKTRNFALQAEVQAGENAKYYTFVLKDVRDTFINDVNQGFGASVNADDLNAGALAGYLKTYTLDAGQLTVSLDTTNPNNSKYTKNTKSVTALVTKMKLGQNVNVDGLKVYLASGTSLTGLSGVTSTRVNADIERAQLYVNDSKIGTVSAISGCTAALTGCYYDFDNSFSLKNNDLVKLVVDFKTNANVGIYKFTFGATNFVTPEYTNGNTVPTASISGSATSNNVEIAASNVSVVENDGYTANQTFMIGSTNQKLFQALVTAGTTSDVSIKTLAFSMSSSSMYTYFTNMYLTLNGVKYELTKDMTSAGTVSFTGINKTLAKNGQMTVALYADVQSGLTNGATSTFTLANTDNGSVLEDSESVATTYTAPTTPALKFSSSATLTATLDSGTAKAGLAIAGTTADLATWRLGSTDGAVDVTDVYVANTDGVNTKVSSADFLVSKYQLVWKGNVISEAAPSAGIAHFNLGTDHAIAVGNGGTEKFTVRAVLNNITAVANTGKTFNLALISMVAQNHGSTAIETISGIQAVVDPTYDSNYDLPGNKVAVVKTAPSLATVNTLGTLSNGATEIYRFTVTAPAAGDVTWNKVVLSVGGSCTGGAIAACLGATTTGNMYLKESGTNLTPAVFSTSTGKLVIELGTNVQTVSANSSKTYYVEANLTGFTIANDSLTVNIKDAESDFTAGAYSLTSGSFRWADNSGSYESTSDAQWFAGYKVTGLDTNSFKLQK